MTCDVRNMLRQASEVLDRSEMDDGEYAFMLNQLGDHLKDLHDRWKAGDKGVVDEFFDLYVIHADQGAQP